MIHKMRRGESVIKLDIVLSTIPSGNEVSDELRQVLDRKAGALVRANRRYVVNAPTCRDDSLNST